MDSVRRGPEKPDYLQEANLVLKDLLEFFSSVDVEFGPRKSKIYSNSEKPEFKKNAYYGYNGLGLALIKPDNINDGELVEELYDQLKYSKYKVEFIESKEFNDVVIIRANPKFSILIKTFSDSDTKSNTGLVPIAHFIKVLNGEAGIMDIEVNADRGGEVLKTHLWNGYRIIDVDFEKEGIETKGDYDESTMISYATTQSPDGKNYRGIADMMGDEYSGYEFEEFDEIEIERSVPRK